MYRITLVMMVGIGDTLIGNRYSAELRDGAIKQSGGPARMFTVIIAVRCTSRQKGIKWIPDRGRSEIQRSL